MSKLGTSENPLLVAIIGSGPSGFYAAETLIKSNIEVNVDVRFNKFWSGGLIRLSWPS